MLENARHVLGLRRALPRLVVTGCVDEDGLARADVAHEVEPEDVHGAALGGHHDLLRAIVGGTHAERQRSDAVRVPERHDAVAVDHRHRGVGALAPLVNPAQRFEHVLGVRFQRPDLVQFVGEHVQQDLGVRIRIDVAQVAREHVRLELPGVREVAVVREADAVGCVDVHGLRLRSTRRASRRVADVADPHVPPQPLHVALLEDLAHQAVALA